jgi:WD40 repeat protein
MPLHLVCCGTIVTLSHERVPDAARALAFDLTGVILVSASHDRTIRYVEVGRTRRSFALPYPEQGSAGAFSPDRPLPSSADDAGNLTLGDVSARPEWRSVKVSDAEIRALAFSLGGRTLAAGCVQDPESANYDHRP